MDKVKIFLVNGINVEGYIKYYSTEEVILSNGIDDGTIVILNPEKNIIFYCIYPENKQVTKQIKTDKNYIEDIPMDIPEVHETDPYLRLKSIHDLRLEQKKIEEEKIRQQLTTFNLGSAEKAFKYEYPRKLQDNNCTKKTSGGNGDHLRKLRKL